MGIKIDRKPVYDSVVDLEHTGDVIWQTALNITGRGEAEVRFAMDSNAVGEYKITIDGTLLLNGTIGLGQRYGDYRFEVKWNVSLLIEYRTNNLAQISYCDIAYYNR